MLTALDADPGRLDQHEQKFVQQIREHGWFGTHVGADDVGPGFSYTTGFWLKFRFPEVILFSMSRETAHDTFWHIYRELEAGRRLPVGEPTGEIFGNAAAVLLPVALEQYEAHLGWSRWFMEMTVSSVSSLCFRIEAESFRGRQDRQRVSELLNLI